MTIKVTRPAPLDRFEKSEHAGHHLVFVGPKAETLDTSYGETDAARCVGVLCVTCVRGWPDVVVFGTALVPRICNGDPAPAGVLVQGEAKPGRQPPWLLDDLDDDDLEEVQAFVDKVVQQLGSGKLVVDFDALCPSDPPETEERF
jgi:hypothetical protein